MLVIGEKMKKEFVNRKGFTIVELLVVIAIIAILAGAITMGVNGMFYKSRRIGPRDALKRDYRGLSRVVSGKVISLDFCRGP